MQQIYLTGANATQVAARLFHALNIHPAGYTVQPFALNGHPAGEALHLLIQPPMGYANDVPYRVILAEHGEKPVTALVPDTLNRIAAPALRQVTGIGVPLLIGFADGAMLACEDFLSAVKRALHGGALCVTVAGEDAEAILRHASPESAQLWLDTADPDAALAAALDEAMQRLRFGA